MPRVVRKKGEKYLESFEIQLWRKTEKIKCVKAQVANEEVLKRVTERQKENISNKIVQ